MKKINIQLNKASVEQAINHLKFLRSQIPKMMDEFLEFACLWIIKRANFYIDSADLGDIVKLRLRNGWSYNIVGGTATLSNSVIVKKRIGYGDDRSTEEVPLSVLVEFGVGVVGQTNPHPNANTSGYQYNKDSKSKSFDGAWTFFTDEEELDLPTSSLLAHNWYEGERGVDGENGRRLIVMTKGAQGVMYAYNALVDARIDLQNPNGEFATELKNLKVRYGLA